MEQQEKQLLLKDLCGRLPYFENWVQYEGKDYIVTGYGHGRVSLLPSVFSSIGGLCPLVEEVKPYLRSMSSMTEEEEIDFTFFWEEILSVGKSDDMCVLSVEQIDWLNTYHFDYRGLIDKGLALEAPEGMYKQ